jgi:hypothetical protein
VIDVRLKQVVSTSFNKSCHTQLEEFRTGNKANIELVANLKQGEAVMFLSLGENQLRFCYKPIEAERGELLGSAKCWMPDHVHTSYFWLQIRLSGRWNPLMLANIAKRAGINLVGLKHFEEYYEHLLTEDRITKREVKEKRRKGG